MLRQSLIACCTVLSAAAVPFTAPSAQERPDILSTGNGIRALGLAYATTAVIDDATSIGWNPAGLTYLKVPDLQVSTRFLITRTSGTTTNNVPPIIFPKYFANPAMAGGVDAVDFIGIGVPLRVAGRRVVPGLALRRFTEGPRPGGFQSVRQMANGNYFSNFTYSTTGGPRAISPSLGVEITRKIRVGATVNIIHGESHYEEVRAHPFRYKSKEIDYGGTAIDVGALVQATRKLRLGAQVTLPHERTMTFVDTAPPVATTREAPLAIAVGAAYSLSSRAKLVADVRVANWSNSVLTNAAGTDTIPTLVGVHDAHSVHVGYEVNRSNGLSRSTLRAGLFGERGSAADSEGQPINSFGAAAGGSWHGKRLSFDFGLMYARSSGWTRYQAETSRLTLVSNELIVGMGFKRHF